MGKITITLMLILPTLAGAQNYQNMSEADMRNMMQQAEKMQACMAGIDQSDLEKFEQRANQMQTKVEGLCASGKRDEAQQQAMAFAQELMNNPDIQKIVECGKKMSGMLPKLPYMDQANGSGDSVQHVCDQ